ncbi:MAG TPA: hypothetical protein DDY37_04935 [Legionella sp.]|nr:hypothetical protein [Legionella sp.]
MKKIKWCMLLIAVFSIHQATFAAKLCAVVSRDTLWTGGVFSVMTETGQTIATSSVVGSGQQGCTPSFAAGTYLVRFTGVRENERLTFMDGIYGCLTQSYVFDEASVLTVVFHDGRPPFNDNFYCYPV